jgi:hypothetical protein
VDDLDWHRKCGPIVQIAQTEVMVASPGAMDTTYGMLGNCDFSWLKTDADAFCYGVRRDTCVPEGRLVL